MNYNAKDLEKVRYAFCKSMEWNQENLNPIQLAVASIWASAYLQSGAGHDFALFAVQEFFSEKNIPKICLN